MHDLIQTLHEKAKSLAETFRKTEVELIDVLQKIEEHKVFLHLGYESLFSYAVEELGLSEANASNFIVVARKSREVPLLKEEIEKGQLTVAKARKLTPVLTVENAQGWITKAKILPKYRLEKEIAAVLPKMELPTKFQFVTANRMHLELGLDEAVMKRLLQIQDLLSSKRKKAVNLEEVLAVVSEEYVQRHDPVEKAQRRKERLARKEKPASANLRVRDTRVGKERSRNREPLPYWLYEEVMHRDQRRCTFVHANGKRCRMQRLLNVHHIIPVSQGGKNEIDNLKTICFNHHRYIHMQLEQQNIGRKWGMDLKIGLSQQALL